MSGRTPRQRWGPVSARWLRITSTSLDVSTDGEYLRWTLPVDAVEWLACELHPDGVSRELYSVLGVAEELRRQAADVERFGFCIVMVERDTPS